MHAKIENGQVVEWPIVNLRKRLPEISLPAVLSDDNLPDGFVRVHSGSLPNYDQSTHKVIQGSPVKNNQGRWETSYDVVELSEEELLLKQRDLVLRYEQLLDNHLNQVAIDDRWESRVTFALRAGYPNKWQNKAIAFGTWMDSCNELAYALMDQVIKGEVPLPSEEEFIAMLPVFDYVEPEQT